MRCFAFPGEARGRANWIRSAESNRVFASQLLLMGILIPKLGENNRKIVEAGFRFLLMDKRLQLLQHCVGALGDSRVLIVRRPQSLRNLQMAFPPPIQFQATGHG